MSETGLNDAVKRKGSLWQTMAAVVWSFLGIRRASDNARDISQLNPVHVVIGGIIGAALFVLVLVLLVNWVVGSGVAA